MTDATINDLKYVKGVKAVGATAGVLSGAITVGEVIYNSELRASNILDGTVTALSFIPGYGWVIGGTYFLTDVVTKKITGMDIGEHLDSRFNGGVIKDW